MSYYDDMEQVAYPLVGIDDLGVPQDVLVDLQVTAPAAVGQQLQVLSCSVTNLVVSVVLGIDTVQVGYLTLPLDQVDVHQPYEIVPVIDGITGFVVFGQGIRERRMRVDGPYQAVPSCLGSYDGNYAAGTVMVNGRVINGVVDLSVGPGLSLSVQDLRLRMPDASIRETTAVVISAVATETVEEPVHRCQERADGVLGDLPIRSINGVLPSPTGELSIQVVSVQQTQSEPAITTQATTTGFQIIDPTPMCQGATP